jgi:hypothetical protein
LIVPRTPEVERAVRGGSIAAAIVKLVGKVFNAVGTRQPGREAK